MLSMLDILSSYNVAIHVLSQPVGTPRRSNGRPCMGGMVDVCIRAVFTERVTTSSHHPRFCKCQISEPHLAESSI